LSLFLFCSPRPQGFYILALPSPSSPGRVQRVSTSPNGLVLLSLVTNETSFVRLLNSLFTPFSSLPPPFFPRFFLVICLSFPSWPANLRDFLEFYRCDPKKVPPFSVPHHPFASSLLFFSIVSPSPSPPRYSGFWRIILFRGHFFSSPELFGALGQCLILTERSHLFSPPLPLHDPMFLEALLYLDPTAGLLLFILGLVDFAPRGLFSGDNDVRMCLRSSLRSTVRGSLAFAHLIWLCFFLFCLFPPPVWLPHVRSPL